MEVMVMTRQSHLFMYSLYSTNQVWPPVCCRNGDKDWWCKDDQGTHQVLKVHRNEIRISSVWEACYHSLPLRPWQTFIIDHSLHSSPLWTYILCHSPFQFSALRSHHQWVGSNIWAPVKYIYHSQSQTWNWGGNGLGDDRGWDGWMASPTQWTWVWVNSRSWWWTGKPGMLQSMGSQRLSDWNELNWIDCLRWMVFEQELFKACFLICGTWCASTGVASSITPGTMLSDFMRHVMWPSYQDNEVSAASISSLEKSCAQQGYIKHLKSHN